MPANLDQQFISSNARKKLNAFCYKLGEKSAPSPKSETPAEIVSRSKENQGPSEDSTAKTVILDTDEEKPSYQPEVSNPVKECPQTPGNRIPLADLIGNSEDAFNKTPKQEHTPVEQVIWQHVPMSSSGASANRGRKRQRSSSPASSPFQNLTNAKELFDLRPSQALLTTPQNDVAAELWNSYVGKSSVEGNGGTRLASICPTSPQTPASERARMNSSEVRRSSSCSADFPNCRTKRRRLWGDSQNFGRNPLARSSSDTLNLSSKMNSLLHIIERNKQKSSARPATGRSSSSFSKISPNAMNRSPSLSKAKRDSHAVEHVDKMKHNDGNDGRLDKSRRDSYKRSSSDYGDDDDFDREFLKLAEASIRNSLTLSEPDLLDSSSEMNSPFQTIESNLRMTSARPAAGQPTSSPSNIRSDAMNRSPSLSKAKTDSHTVEDVDKMRHSDGDDDSDLDKIRRDSFKGPSSDYGDDDDFDKEFLKMAEASMPHREDRSPPQGDQQLTAADLNLRLEPQQPGNMHTCQPVSMASDVDANMTNSLTAVEGTKECTQGFAEVLTRNGENAAGQQPSIGKDQQPFGELASATDNSVTMAHRKRQHEAEGSRERSSGDEFDDDELDMEAIEQSMSMIESGSGQVCSPRHVHWP